VGVTRADFAAATGETVSVEIVKAIDGSKYGYLQKITFPNGNQISLESQKEE
jgi:ribosome maturation factor RimP